MQLNTTLWVSYLPTSAKRSFGSAQHSALWAHCGRLLRMSKMAVMQRKPDTRSSDSIHQSTRCRCLEREGWMEDNSCPITNFPQSSQNTVPRTRDASSGRNARCSRNRSGPSGRGSNWPEISEILRCSTLPSTVNCAAAILSG